VAFYRMDMAAVETAVGEMQGINRQIGDALGDLATMATSTLAEWENSPAKAYYESKKTQWDQMAATMNSDLATASQALGGIHEAVGHGERYAAGLWN
jgi:WXG100 family type VII secretion target